MSMGQPEYFAISDRGKKGRRIMEKTDKIYVAGHRGLVGSAIVRSLQEKGYTNIVNLLLSQKDIDTTIITIINQYFI